MRAPRAAKIVDRAIDIDGVRTRYRMAGEGQPVVLVHGGSFGSDANARDWDPVIGQLGCTFGCYALDKLGQGHTDNPRSDSDYTMRATIEHIRDFIDAMGVRRAVLVGHSRGALPAAFIAINHPDLCSALVVVSSNTLAPDHPATPRDFYSKLRAGRPDTTDLSVMDREPAAQSYSRRHITPEFLQGRLDAARLSKTAVALRKMERLRRDQFLPDVQRQKGETLRLIEAGALSAPTLVVWGYNDPSAPVALAYALYRSIASGTSSAELHILNEAGHYPYREHPLRFVRLVKEFARSFGATS